MIICVKRNHPKPMKSNTKIGSNVILLAFLLGMPLFGAAQNESDVAAFLKATGHDANVLITGYTNPLIKGASYGATGGWFNTAKAHKTLGFDLGVTMTLAFIPTSDDYFNPTGLSSQTVFNGNSTNPSKGAPTFLGPKDATSYTTNTEEGPVTIKGPEGLDLRHYIHFAAVPVPMIQLGVGIIKNTDIKFRYLPTLKRGDSKVSLFGLGIMHDVKQYLPGSDLLPFDLSVLVAYTSIRGQTSLINSDASNKGPISPDGKFAYKLNSWVGQAIISKKLAVITFYAAAGFGSVTTNADITGTFNLSTDEGVSIGQIKDPYSTKFKNNTGKLTGGMRLKLGPIYFVGDYTLQKYNALTIGLGVAIR
jgi:hypothetical protein